MPKKQLTDFSPQNLNRFLIESARSEQISALAGDSALLGIRIFHAACGKILANFATCGLRPLIAIWLMLLYALAVNIPCILAQRYNRIKG